tara:strand:+ start:368 stop:514 length:147 start_codon:yes stop_codon:yes gene_type:complete
MKMINTPQTMRMERKLKVMPQKLGMMTSTPTLKAREIKLSVTFSKKKI